MVMQWGQVYLPLIGQYCQYSPLIGQLVDHDILATAGEFFDCCQNDIK